MPTAATAATPPTLSHTAVRRFLRVGSTPVLEILVTYPILSLPDTGTDSPQTSAVERFNQAYSAMAEAFFAHCAGTPRERATEAFCAAGPSAVYTFDRRTIACRMEADRPDGPLSSDGILTIRRTVSVGSRRGRVSTFVRESEECWRAADLTLRGRGKRPPKNVPKR